jgi:hypothetical protein
MKYFISILSTAAAITLSNFASASESVLPQDFAGASIGSHTPQAGPVSVKTAMGPTSAPQKPGGTGQEPQQTPKVHRKTKHYYTAS